MNACERCGTCPYCICNSLNCVITFAHSNVPVLDVIGGVGGGGVSGGGVVGCGRRCTVGIRTGFQGLFRGKWVETSYKGRNQLQGRYKGESTRPVIHGPARFQNRGLEHNLKHNLKHTP